MVVCVKNNLGGKKSNDRDFHHKNATDTLSHTFGSAKHFVTRNLEVDS